MAQRARRWRTPAVLAVVTAVVGVLAWLAVDVGATFRQVDTALSADLATFETVTADVVAVEEILGVRVATIAWSDDDADVRTRIPVSTAVEADDVIELRASLDRYSTAGGSTPAVRPTDEVPEAVRERVRVRATWLWYGGIGGMIAACAVAAMALDRAVAATQRPV